jgi:hypothetical protein
MIDRQKRIKMGQIIEPVVDISTKLVNAVDDLHAWRNMKYLHPLPKG